MSGSAISPLTHRSLSAGGRHRFVHCGHRGTRNDLLRLDVVDFHAFQAPKASQVDLVVTVPDVSNDRIVLFSSVQSDDVEVTR